MKTKIKISKSVMTHMAKMSQAWNNTGYAVLNSNGSIAPSVWNQWKNEDPQREIIALVNGNDGWRVRNDNYEWEINPSELMDELIAQALSEDKQLADAIHKKTCRWNHIDGCSYHKDGNNHIKLFPIKNQSTTSEEKLQQLASLLEQAGIRKYTCMNGFGYSLLERDIVSLLSPPEPKEENKYSKYHINMAIREAIMYPEKFMTGITHDDKKSLAWIEKELKFISK